MTVFVYNDKQRVNFFRDGHFEFVDGRLAAEFSSVTDRRLRCPLFLGCGVTAGMTELTVKSRRTSLRAEAEGFEVGCARNWLNIGIGW